MPSFCGKVFTNGQDTRLGSRCGPVPTTSNSASEPTTAMLRFGLDSNGYVFVFRCWKDRVAHDENKYLAALARQGSPLNSVVLAATATTV